MSKVRSCSCCGVVMVFLVLLTASATAQSVSAELVKGLKWRLIGPFRGGRAVAVAGVPGDSTTFYFGAVNGGVWKTTDAGTVWNPIFDSQPVGAIGAIAVAPSDSKTIYAGTGESDIRSNLSSGNGVYKSVDGGSTWMHIGLEDTRQISRIVVDPRIRTSSMSGRSVMPTVPTNSVVFTNPSMEGRIGARFSIKDPMWEFQIWRSVRAIRRFYLPAPGTRTVLHGARMLPSMDPAADCIALKKSGQDVVAPQRQRIAGRRLGTGCRG